MRNRFIRNFKMASICLTLLGAPLLTAEEPLSNATTILFWSQDQKESGYKDIDNILPTRKISAGSQVYALSSSLVDLSKVKYSIDGQLFTLEDHMQTLRVAGLLVHHKGKVVYEKYGLGNDKNSKWIAFSVAKSVTSMLIGAAIQDGYINSVDDHVIDYLPRLRGSAYENATIKNVLNMASGVKWNEDYFDPESDVSKAGGFNAMELINYLNTLDVAGKPGEKFNYSTGETNLVGAILRAAIGNNEAAYLQQKIWQPFGMESDANWVIDSKYQVELGGCCLNATLRDYLRLGLFAMNDGVLPNGERVLPEGWMKESTQASKSYDGYGYLWWLMPDGSYAAMGIFGQLIWINPTTETIIVTHSAWPKAVGEDLSAHRWAMIEAIMAELH